MVILNITCSYCKNFRTQKTENHYKAKNNVCLPKLWLYLGNIILLVVLLSMDYETENPPQAGWVFCFVYRKLYTYPWQRGCARPRAARKRQHACCYLADGAAPPVAEAAALSAGRNTERREAPLTAAVPSVGCADISPHCGESPSERSDNVSDRWRHRFEGCGFAFLRVAFFLRKTGSPRSSAPHGKQCGIIK